MTIDNLIVTFTILLILSTVVQIVADLRGRR